MAGSEDFTFPSASGRNDIHGRIWLPAGAPRGVVVIVHGVAEHIGRYGEFADYLTEHGLAAAGDDHLGHGLSVNDPSELGWFAGEDGWNLLIRDEKTLRDRMAARFPGLPLILLGHSMGSFIARTYICAYPGDYDLCVLTGTGHTPGALCALGRALARREIRLHGGKFRSEALQKLAFGRYLRGIENPGGPYDWTCRDEAVRQAYARDPLCGGTATAELMYEMLGGLALIGRKSHMEKTPKDLPMLLLSGAEDPVGGWGRGVGTVYRRLLAAGVRDVTLRLYPGARHEVLNELNRGEVWSDLLRWIDERLENRGAAP